MCKKNVLKNKKIKLVLKQYFLLLLIERQARGNFIGIVGKNTEMSHDSYDIGEGFINLRFAFHYWTPYDKFTGFIFMPDVYVHYSIMNLVL